VAQKTGRDRNPRLLNESQIAGLTAQSGCLVVGVVLLAVVAGIWLDKVLDTRPMLTLALVLGSLPLSIYLLFRVAMRAMTAARNAAPNADKEPDGHDTEA
jgi:F0F1-type ATP synthase assembly protein I